MSHPAPDAAKPRQGEVWAFTASIAGRNAPSSLGPDLVVVVSNSHDNKALPHVQVLPVSDAPPTDLTVLLSNHDPVPAKTVDVTRARVMPKRWLIECKGPLTRSSLRQIFAAQVQYLCPEPD